ncbi:DUF6090 family protein [Aegicerativicinus sediminis]|uniref:DUF6090 family protein n=1 Tax=Aegicerativicinus sediminis TaxID=2893202 RepID=UPI001E47C4F7|nr:DUF6090 family protein [Aegicerativicinus sediminis]
MISLFRKIRQKLLSENKFSRYLFYAIGEIVLVMIGILLALQVNNWNENRKINKQELQLLRSLKKEFTYNKDELNRSILKTQLIQKRCETILNNTGNNEMTLSEYESDSLINSGLLNIISYDPSNGIMSDIINSGKIHIIKNEELKNHLSNWNGLLNDVKEDETWAINERNNISFPFLYKNSNYTKITENIRDDTSITSGFETDYTEIYQSLEFENLVNSQRIWNMKNERNYIRLKERIEKIISLCDQEISSKK